MKTFIILSLVVFNSAFAYSVKPRTDWGKVGESWGKAMSDSFNYEYYHQRDLQHQREQLEILREQMIWEKENGFNR